jgi:5-methylcytosine-specific restriction endonuclease McrA
MTSEQKAAIRERENAARRVRVKTPEQIEREKEYHKIYRETHKKKISEANRALYRNKKSEIKAYQTKYYSENKSEVLRKNESRRQSRKSQYAEARRRGHRKYYTANKDKIAKRRKIYNARNPQVAIAHQAKRRAQAVKTVIDEAGIKAWMKDIRSKPFVRCHWCGTKIHGSQICFDHIVPLSKEGHHVISNLCAACRPCNSSKGARVIADWIVNGQTFLPI